MPHHCQGQSACLCQGSLGPTVSLPARCPCRVVPQEGMICIALLLRDLGHHGESCTRRSLVKGRAFLAAAFPYVPCQWKVVRSNFLLGPRAWLTQPLNLILTMTEVIASRLQDLSSQSHVVTALRLSLQASPQGPQSSSSHPTCPGTIVGSEACRGRTRSRALGASVIAKDPGAPGDLPSRPCQPWNSGATLGKALDFEAVRIASV